MSRSRVVVRGGACALRPARGDRRWAGWSATRTRRARASRRSSLVAWRAPGDACPARLPTASTAELVALRHRPQRKRLARQRGDDLRRHPDRRLRARARVAEAAVGLLQRASGRRAASGRRGGTDAGARPAATSPCTAQAVDCAFEREPSRLAEPAVRVLRAGAGMRRARSDRPRVRRRPAAASPWSAAPVSSTKLPPPRVARREAAVVVLLAREPAPARRTARGAASSGRSRAAT